MSSLEEVRRGRRKQDHTVIPGQAAAGPKGRLLASRSVVFDRHRVVDRFGQRRRTSGGASSLACYAAFR
jgi:hypothetical protein